MQYTHEHLEVRKTLKRFIDEHINPHVDEWEAAEIFPAHEVVKGLGRLGLLGLTASGISFVAAPISALWLLLAIWLGRAHRRLLAAPTASSPPTPNEASHAHHAS